MPLQHPQKCILENFIVIWLDQNINESDPDFQHSISQLRRIVNSVKTFIHADQCIDYLTGIKNEKVFMIVSGTFGQQIMPLIQDIHPLLAIYVFCSDKTTHEQWMKDYHKVKDVFTQIKPLCDILKQDIHQADIDLTPISIISESSATDLNQLDQSFMYSQLLKEILFKMEHDEKAKKQFVEFCQEQYVENESTIQIIREFEREYDRPSPIWWYTRDCFIYSMINKALRTQDLEIILKMGFFNRDLHRQIEHLHSISDDRSPFTVYRGQGMCNAEFEKMQKSEGGLLSFNNFLSTSSDREVAFARGKSARDDAELIGIFFQMEIDPSISTTPFALLDNVSYFSDTEKEILFSMHTVFRIGEMKQIENRFWEVKLTLTSDNDEQLKRLTDHMRKEIGSEIEWLQLSSLMFKMGEFNKAEEIYKAIFDSVPDNAAFHNNIGLIMAKKGDQNTALSHLEKALEMQQRYLPPNHLNLATTHNNIGLVHQWLGDYSTALSHHEKALKIDQKSLSPNHLDLATTHNNIAAVYQSMGEYSTALPHLNKALEIRQKSLPPNHPDLSMSYNNIAAVHQTMGEYSTALSHLDKALKIDQKSLPSNHPDLATSHNNIGEVHRSIGEYSNALEHHEKALEIIQKSLLPNHPNLANAHNGIGMVHQSMGEYSTALSHFDKALEIMQKSLSPNYCDLATTENNIGVAHHSMGKYSTALSHHEKALEICQKSLPPSHPTIAMSHNNIANVHQSMGEYSTALPHHEKALAIMQKSLPSNHRDLAMVHNNIGLLYQSMGEYSTALSHCENALQIGQKSLPPNHPELATVETNIGMVHQSMGQYSTALAHHKKALEIQQKSLLPIIPILPGHTTTLVWCIS